jgi:hypothetical protein
MCFLWGIQEAGLGVFLQCVMGFEFPSKTTPFAVRNLTQSFTVFVCLFFDSVLKTKEAYMWYTVGIGVWACSAWGLMLFKFEFLAKRSEHLINTQNSE